MQGEKYSFYVLCVTERPVFWAVPAFLWGCDKDFDSDGNAFPANSTTWTELSVTLRKSLVAQRIDIDPVATEPLILKVTSHDRHLAARAAYVLAHHATGKMAVDKEGTYLLPDSFVPDLGPDFDLEWAMSEFRKAQDH